jgi:hypothetical protein
MSDYETSNDVDQIAQALVKAQTAMRAASKDAKNPHLKNKYADLNSVREVVLEACSPAGIAITQGAAIGQSGHACIVTQLTHVSGQWVRSRVEVPYSEGKGVNAAQSYGAALSYARRYALSSLLCVAAEDDDAASAGAPRGEVAQQQQAAPTSNDAAPGTAAYLHDLDTVRAINAADSLNALQTIAKSIKSPSAVVKEAYSRRKAALTSSQAAE